MIRERSAGVWSDDEEKAGEEAASGRMPRAGATETKETASAAACADAEKAAGVKNRLLSAKDIRWILAQKLEAPPVKYEALKRSNPELVPRPGEEEEDKKLCGLYVLARAFYEVEERLPKFQDWVRSELKNKGCVEVDGDWFVRKAEAQARIDREWPRVRAKIDALWGPLEGGDGSESESDEGDGEDEDALDSVSVMKDSM